MNDTHFLKESYLSKSQSRLKRSFAEKMHIDFSLLYGLVLLLMIGLLILYSADNQSLALLIRQGMWVIISVGAMLLFAQISPRKYYQWSPWLFILGAILLGAVLVVGHTGNGAQRWLNLKFFHFQPSEIMKLAMPMMLAWYLDKRPLPPDWKTLLFAGVLLGIPVILTAKQPDLGTALMITFAGVSVFFLAGLRWRTIIGVAISAAACAPLLWHFLHDYQRQRVLTFLDPERDPLDAGYHIIQSKIAIGSGGLFGKGYLQGTQSHLQFLPEHATDFIFAVCGEELGLMGSLALIAVLIFIVLRGLYISAQAQDTYSRLLAGSLSLTFFLSFFVNMGMVSGILPVVGVPLPLVSYGGSSMLTIMVGFGIIMSIHTHRKLLRR
jgi:rod shape determining protein RodA